MQCIVQHRIAIGLFHASLKCSSSDIYFWTFIFPNLFFQLWVLPSLLLRCEDIHSNPGPVDNTVTDKSISICYVNVRSLTSKYKVKINDCEINVNKFDEFEAFAMYNRYDIMLVSETWLGEVIGNDIITVQGYLPPYRRDRNRHGGGLAVYISDSVPASRKIDLEAQTIENICIEVGLGAEKILVCSSYRPPNTSIIDFLAGIQSVFENCTNHYTNILILGDMNSKHSDWYSLDKTNYEGKMVKAFFESNGFDQLINDPTHFSTYTESCIDLMFTNNPFIIQDSGVTLPFANCDHAPIYCKLNILYKKRMSYDRHVWDFKRADFDKFRCDLTHVDWNSILSQSDDIDEVCQGWMSAFEGVAKACVPNSVVTIRPRDKPWMTSNIRLLMRRRDRLYKKFKFSKNINHWLAFKALRNEVTSLIRQAKIDFDTKKVQAVIENKRGSKGWWDAYRKLTNKQKPSYSTPIEHNNNLVTDSTTKAELFNTFFTKQSDLDTSGANLPVTPPISQYKIPSKIIQPSEVYTILSRLDVNKATGPDGIGNRLLKEASLSIAEPLCDLLNRSLSCGVFPSMWKLANVIPLHKKESFTQCNNYRPISLLPCISKVFERIIFNHIFNFFKKHKLLSKHQSGFIPGDSTINQLLSLCHKIYSGLDTSDSLLSVFLDFSKAFDKVWHQGLIYKLVASGIHGNLLDWLSSYLTNRKQRVCINGMYSSWLPINAGVPQGSVLGPLLFLVYINDICADINSDIALFADDTSIFRPASGNLQDAVNVLNQDLSSIEIWCKKWFVEVNIAKTHAMLLSRHADVQLPSPIMFKNSIIEVVNEHKHLGVIISKNMSWTPHIDYIVSKAQNCIDSFKSLKYKLDRKSLDMLYNTNIRPILEYGCILFDNCTVADSEKLENIQIQAARIVTGCFKGTSVTGMFSDLAWEPLAKRRINQKLIKYHDIVYERSPEYLRDLLPRLLGQNIRRTRAGSAFLFESYKCSSTSFHNSFFPSTTRLWNSLDSKQRKIITSLPFRSTLFKHQKPSIYHSFGNRRDQVHLTRLRLGFSSLNFHLHQRNLIDSPICKCGHPLETVKHFLLDCPIYREQRHELKASIHELLPNASFTLPLLLRGLNLSDAICTEVCNVVLKYICDTMRLSD